MQSYSSNERGATMMEFAIVFPLFLLITMVIVDFGRASTLRSVVDEAISRTLKRAVSVANLDVEQDGPPQLASSDVQYRRLEVSKKLAAQEGLDFLASVDLLHLQDDSAQTSKRGAKLLDLTYTDTTVSGPPAQETAKLMVLRPGECATVPSTGGTECNRETLGTSSADPAPTQRMDLLMERHPIKVVAYAQIDSYVPFLFKAPLRIEAFGYRQAIPEGQFSNTVANQYGYVEVAAAAPAVVPPLGKPILPPYASDGCDTPALWAAAISLSRLQITPLYPRSIAGFCISGP